jgi:large subunit ribosomal protein L10
MMLLLQHNNLKATEWMGLRRELSAALRKVDATRAENGGNAEGITDEVRIQVIKSGVFGAALRVVEYYNPEHSDATVHATDPRTSTSREVLNSGPFADDPTYTHGLSRAAYEATINKKLDHALEPLFAGPIAIVTFPEVSAEHLKAALQIISPKAPGFPAPKRKASPGYWELPVQNAVQKLMLLGARLEGKVFDTDGTRWVGGIQGGLDGLRGQLVAMLQGVGGSVTSTLEGASKSLYFTVEGRRGMMEEPQLGSKEEKSES